MKKILFTLFMACIMSVPSFGQIQKYQTFSFAYKEKTAYGIWSDWESSNLTITLNLNNNTVTIFSPVTQHFRICDNGTTYTDKSGGSNLKFYCADADDLRCNIIFRREKNGNTQIYVEYNDLIYVYNVQRIS